MTSKFLLGAVLFYVASQTLATQKCNIYNFGTKGLYQCGMQWWQSKDLGQAINFTYKVSKIAEDVMSRTWVSLDQINGMLAKRLRTDSVDPLAKLIESVLAVEPYLTYVVADVILGMNVTAADLRRAYIPEALADRDSLVKLFTNYIELSCSDNGIRPFVSCMKNWLTTNCATEDNASYIVKLLENIRDTYCRGKKADSILISKLSKEVGTVFKTVAEFFGVYVDPFSPYVFNIAADSWVKNPRTVSRLGWWTSDDCEFIGWVMGDDFKKHITPATSTIGAGNIVKYLVNLEDPASRCVFRVMKKFFPDFLDKNRRAIEHLKIISDRYGLIAISDANTNVATSQRHTVSAFGDRHLITYKSQKPMTCTGYGNNGYLTNEFFRLEAVSSPVSQSSPTSSITQVRLRFIGRRSKVNYLTGTGELSTSLLVRGHGSHDIQIKSLGSTVQITDTKSGAVFGIGKYKNSYFFSARMGKHILKGSLGLFTTGCPNPLITTQVFAGRNPECDVACAPVGTFLRNSCLSDCVKTGDKNMSKTSLGIKNLGTELRNEDTKILQMLRTSP